MIVRQRFLLAAALAFAWAAGGGVLAVALAGTTGKIAGQVLDGQKRPLAGVNVALPALRTGAITSDDGRYAILNLPPGAYDLRFQLLGHGPVVLSGVQVSADQTARADAVLSESAVQMQEVVVRSTRPVVDVGKTSSLASVTAAEIAMLPVQDLNDIVNLQAGVVDGHFRGGRIGEVQYQVDGVSVNNAYDNKSTLRLDRSLLQEVQVISGTFDAEYGQAQSGVVNAILKRGSEDFRWNAEAYVGGFVFPGSAERRVVEYEPHPAGIRNFQLGLTGPTGLPRTLFLLSARRYEFDDWVRGLDIFRPADRIDSAGVHPTGSGDDVPLGTSREWTGVAKVSNRSFANVELSYQAIVNLIDGRRPEWGFRFAPESRTKQHTFSVTHGLDVNHTLDARSFYTMSVRQNYFDYHDWAYPDLYDPRYDVGDTQDSTGFADAFVTVGVSPSRFKQNTNTLVFKGSYVRQASDANQLKAGFDFQLPRVEFGTPGHLVYSQEGGTLTLRRYVDQPPDYPGTRLYFPVIAAWFAQNQLEWNDLTARTGLRLDLFDARSSLPSDLANPANAIAGAPLSTPRPASKKWALSPRLGVSWPTGPRSAAHFAYGHFAQFPSIGDVFRNSDYGVLANLQATPQSTAEIGVLGNPDIAPERTIQYEGGYKQAVSADLGVDLTVFYKNIKNLLGVEFIETYTGAEYSRLTNIDYGNVLGFTVAFDLRPSGLFGMTLDYTWQEARGNSSDPRETATRAAAGEDARPRQIPFNWDQRHTVNLTATLARPDHFTLSTIVRAGSGQPYTPTTVGGFGYGQEANSGRKPSFTLVDLRGEKTLRVGALPVRAFLRVFNLFDTRVVNGFVFSDTGSPDYARFPDSVRGILNDPTRFYAPRRIELGVSMAGPARTGGTP